MCVLRAELHACQPAGLSLPQFRALVYVDRHPDASLSEIAEHIGLSLPSLSKLMDTLVQRCDVRHDVATDDRRRACFCLTPDGHRTLAAVRDEIQQRLMPLLAAYSVDEQAQILAVMQLLFHTFSSAVGRALSRDAA